MLSTWKENNQTSSALPKPEFPKLLKRLEESIEMRRVDNVISGFRKCGLIPLDRNAVLKRLPGHKEIGEISSEDLSAGVLEMLRKNSSPPTMRRTKRSKVNVAPGKSVCTNDFDDGGDTVNGADLVNDDTSSEESEDEELNGNEDEVLAGVKKVVLQEIHAGDWVVVNFADPTLNRKLYLGRIEQQTSRRSFLGEFLRAKGRSDGYQFLFFYPENEDICEFDYEQVVGKVEPPITMRRGIMKFKCDSSQW